MAPEFSNLKSSTLHWKRVFPATDATLPLASIKAVGCRTVVDSAYRIKGRRRKGQTHCVFHYSLNGLGEYVSGGEHRPLLAGHGVLCRVADPRVVFGYPPEAREPWRFVFLSYDGTAAKAMTDTLTERHGHVFSLPLEHPHAKRLLDFKNSGTDASNSPAENAELVIHLLLTLLKEAETHPRTDHARKLVQKVQMFIEKHLDEPLMVQDIAQALSVSREHLTRIHKAETGLTLHAYIQQQKLRTACKLLAETDQSHAAIARRLGFKSSTQFARVFKSAQKITPRQYRTSERHSDY